MKKIAVSVLALLAAAPASALDTAVGVTAGTFGAGATVSLGISDNIGVRFQLSEYSTDEEVDADDIDYDAELEIGGFGALFDYYPFGGKFRLSTGLFSNQSSVVASASPEPGTEIGSGDNTYQTEQGDSLDMDLDFGGVAPFFGIGWGKAAGEGMPIGFGVDLGVVAMNPGLDLELELGDPSSNSDAIQRAVEQEERQADEDLDDFNLYPVLQASVSYRF
ncbi:MAG: hypothetical protein ACQES2_09025 [Pseudomonadota bacterium]